MTSLIDIINFRVKKQLPNFNKFICDLQEISDFSLQALAVIYTWLNEIEDTELNFTYDPFNIYYDYLEGTLSELQCETFGNNELTDAQFYNFMVENTNFKKLPTGKYVMEKIYI